MPKSCVGFWDLLIPNLFSFSLIQNCSSHVEYYQKQIYHQGNFARKFQFKYEILQLTQGTMSVQEYYSRTISLWTDYTEIISSDVSSESLSTIQSIHNTSYRDPFLMKLWPKFEIVHSNLMNRVPSPSLDAYFIKLLQKEQRLVNQTELAQEGQSMLQIASSPSWHLAHQHYEIYFTTQHNQIFFCSIYVQIILIFTIIVI